MPLWLTGSKLRVKTTKSSDFQTEAVSWRTKIFLQRETFASSMLAQKGSNGVCLGSSRTQNRSDVSAGSWIHKNMSVWSSFSVYLPLYKEILKCGRLFVLLRKQLFKYQDYYPCKSRTDHQPCFLDLYFVVRDVFVSQVFILTYLPFDHL